MLFGIVAALGALTAAGIELRDTDPPRNAALGKPSTFAPTPNYSLTAKGDTDAADLTDGTLSSREDLKLWFDAKAVGCSYAGLAQVAVDLGKLCAIEEVAIRFQGGSPQAGICIPGWLEVVVSDDGTSYYRAASYSKWRPGDKEKYAIPRNEGEAWVHRLRFRDLRTRGRFVGLSFYCSGLTVADELYVFRGSHNADEVEFDPADLTDFTVSAPKLYFHKPRLYFSTNINTPNPIGLIVPHDAGNAPMSVNIDLPHGTRFVGGSIGGEQVLRAARTAVENGAYTRYSLELTAPGASTKTWGRVYISGDWPSGERGALRYRLSCGTHVSPLMPVPLEAMRIEPAPTPKRLMTSLGWWNLTSTLAWPDALRAFRAIGLNTISTFGHWMKDDEAQWELLERARREGFKILNIDSTYHRILDRHKREGELYCQFEDGTHGTRLCPSYRGKFYQEELRRIAGQCARVKPNYLSTDIELWSWRGPVDAEKCTRCKADFARSGVESWEQWQLQKGYEMWRDLVTAVRDSVRAAGGPEVEFGCYDWRPGQNYQFTWPFDRLYPEHLQNSQVSTYTPLEPYHIALVGDEARADRQRLPRTDVLPWITPGDAGTFPGRAFKYALLECFANGSRGVHFWSGRVWDTESLAAYADVIRAIAPVEDVIIGGDLLEGASTEPQVRLSGVRRGDEMVLLIAEYFGTEPLTVTVSLPTPGPSTVTDLMTGKALAAIAGGERSFQVRLGVERAGLVHVRPR